MQKAQAINTLIKRGTDEKKNQNKVYQNIQEETLDMQIRLFDNQ